MRIGGLQKLTLIDYPGKVAAIVFTQGCNLRCGYCHNPELVLSERYGPRIPEAEVLAFLDQRRLQLQGIVVTGGEPTLQKDLACFLRKIKERGLAVKLDTNGTRPDVLERVIEERLVDYLAMDIKTSLAKYDAVAGTACNIEDIAYSIRLIQNCGIDHEFRTTAIKPLCSPEDLEEIRALIGPYSKYRIQHFRVSGKIIDPDLANQVHYSAEDVDRFNRNLTLSGEKKARAL